MSREEDGVADSITWDLLRELAGFRAVRGCAVSLYLRLDPRDVPTPGDARARTRAVLAAAARQLEERSPSLARDAREALRGDLERLREWLESEFERDGAHGVAVFVAGLDDVWRSLPLVAPVDDLARIDRELYLAPLVRLVDRAEGALVAYVGRERADLYRLRGGRLVEIADRTTDVPGQHDQGGWAQARFERHIEAIVSRHLAEVAAALDASVRRVPGAPAVLVGPEGIRPELDDLLADETRSSVVGWATVEAHADAGRLLDVALPLLSAWRSGQDEEVLDRWRQEAATNGRAASGWEETLAAASDGRVELLLVREGVDRPASRCPTCGRVEAGEGVCPLDDTPMEIHDSGLDLAVHQTLNHGGVVRMIADRRDLEPVDGIAALLRF